MAYLLSGCVGASIVLYVCGIVEMFIAVHFGNKTATAETREEYMEWQKQFERAVALSRWSLLAALVVAMTRVLCS